MDMVAGLIKRNGKLLLIHNTKYGLRIEPPGGKKHPEESWKQAVIREIEEELGIRVQVKKFFGAYHTLSPEGEFDVRMYWCTILEGEPRTQEPEKSAGHNWYSFEEMEQLMELVPNMQMALPKLKHHLTPRKWFSRFRK